MAAERSVERQAAPDRRPAAAALVSAASVAQRVSAGAALQRRLGNRGVIALMARAPAVEAQAPVAPSAAPLHVSSPSDPAEREAVSTAARVMASADPGPVAEAPAHVQRDAAAGAGGGPAPAGVSSSIASEMRGGAALPGSVRGFMEPRFGADFSNVRVHTGDRAASLSGQLNARAFTVGGHIFFGQGQFRPETQGGKELIAHELTHTVQQGATARRSIQRDGAGSALGDLLGLSADGLAMRAVNTLAPDLKPFISGAGGLVSWLTDKASGVVDGAIKTLMAPVNVIAGAGATVGARLAPMLATLQAAGAQIAKNDCTPLRDAADKIEKTAAAIITPIVETVQPILAAVKGFLSTLWDKLGAPIWDWIKQYAAAQWDMIVKIAGLAQRAAVWLWDTNVSAAQAAWKWLKGKLGMDDAADAAGGVWDWVQRKLGAVWDAIKAKLAPFTAQLKTVALTVGAVLVALSPAGPLIAIGKAVMAAAPGLRWIAANWGKGNIIATARTYIEKSLIPPLLAGARGLGASVAGMVRSVGGAISSFAASITGAVGALGGAGLAFLTSAIQWLASQAEAFAAFVEGQLGNLEAYVSAALDRLQSFLNTVLTFLGRVADVVLDVWGLPVLLGEKVWNAIPACIRDPIVDFLGPIILQQIEIFQELARDNEAWQKTKAEIGKIIKLVFHDHDLMGAVKATFFLVLRVFNTPPELIATVVAKAMSAWDVVVKKPLDFIKNTIRSLGEGFKILWANKIENLKLGLQGWLLGEVKEKDLAIPTNWTDPRQLFDFALSVLGISVDHVFELLKKRFDPVKVEKIRRVLGKVAGVLGWVDKSIDLTKTPAENAKGMVGQAKDFGKSILTGLAEWVAGKVAEEVAVTLAAAAATAGFSEILDIAKRIYRAFKTAVRWARRILDMANEALDNVLDIAGGAVAKVGQTFAKLMQRGMPVVIGFLADQVGLGGVGEALRKIIDKLREKVDAAILWLIDKIKAGIEWLIGFAKSAVGKITDWWKSRKQFTADDGSRHTLYFTGQGASAVLTVATTPRPVDAFLREARSKIPAGDAAAAAALSTANRLLIATDDLRRELLKPDNPKLPAEIDQLNGDLELLAKALQVLVPIVMPAPPGPAPAMFATNSLIKLIKENLVAKVVSYVTTPQGLMIRFSVVSPRQDRSVANIPTAFLASKLGEYYSEYTEDPRNLYMGSNPSRTGDVGQAIEKRMRAQGKIVGSTLKNARDGKIYELRDCEMGHIIDAVNWWNTQGRFTGARSAAVQRFMGDPNNYEFEPREQNQARGAALGARARYLPPTV